MDIFISQLKRITRVPIKQESLKVKAPVKDAEPSALTDDLDHLENHEQFFAYGNKDESKNEHAESDTYEHTSNDESDNQNLASSKHKEEYTPDNIVPDFSAYARKPRNINVEGNQGDSINKDKNNKKEDPPEHLDLYV